MAELPTLGNNTNISQQALPTLGDDYEEEEDILPTLGDDYEEEEEDILPTLGGLEEEQKDPNTFTNFFLNAKDNMEYGIYKSLSLFSDDLIESNPDLGNKLKLFSNSGMERNKQQIESRPEPTRSLDLFKDVFPEVKEDVEAGNYFDALARSGQYIKDGVALGLGSTIPTLAGAIPATVVGATVGIPTIGSIIGALIPSSLAAKAFVYEEAKALGADERKARDYSTTGGLVIGLLDAILPAYLIKTSIKTIGKKATTDAIQKKVIQEKGKDIAQNLGAESVEEVSKEVAETAVKNATKYVTPSVLSTALKTSGKAGLSEAVTEAAQERTQIATAGLAADLGISPYDATTIKERVLNNAAIGFLTGKSLGFGAGTIKGLNDVNLVSKLNMIEDDVTQAIPSIKNFPDSLATSIEGKETDPKKLGWIDLFWRRSTTPLQNFANRGEDQLQIYNKFINYYNDVNAEVGTKGAIIEKATQNIRKYFKLPFAKSISKKKNDATFRYLTRGERSTDETVNKAGEEYRNMLGTITSPEIVIDRQALKQHIKNNLDILPEIQQALDEGRISVDKSKRFLNYFNTLKETYNPRIQQEVLALDEQFIDQEMAKVFLEMEEDPNFNAIADKVVAPLEGDGMFGELGDVGLDVGFIVNFFPRRYKTTFPWQRKRFKKVMQQKFGLPNVASDTILENIRNNNGFYIPEDKAISLDPFETQAVIDNRQGFEKERRINDEMFKALDDAGLVERNVKKVIDNYVIEAVQRKKIKELSTLVNTNLKRLGKNAIEYKELNLMQDIFNALQHNYSPIRSERIKKSLRNFNTYQYMLTLPFSALTALTEPFILLSRVGPTNAIYGLMKASTNTLRQGMRSVFPKVPLSKAEEASRSILQLYDGTLAERLGNIAGIDINRRVTDTFFRTILLTQVTQFSRDIAFQAGLRQTRQDILDVIRGNTAGKLNKGQINSKKRLTEMGLVEENFNNPEVVTWLEGPLGGRPPLIISKALSKFVDEIIMAPNVVNRPLWMSNPSYSMVALLKGFMFTFGNTVGYRMYREVFKPLAKGRMPLTDAAKYAIAFTLIVAGSMGIKEMKDWIRYQDESSPWKESEGFSRILQAILDSNIFGPGTVIYDALMAAKYGVPPVGVVLGPGAQWLSNLTSALGQFIMGSPRSIARFIANAAIPPSVVPSVRKEPVIEGIEKFVEPASERLGKIFKGD